MVDQNVEECRAHGVYSWKDPEEQLRWLVVDCSSSIEVARFSQ